MIETLFQKFHSSPGLQSLFYKAEFILAGVFIGIVWLLRPKAPDSNFRVRESDLLRSQKKSKPTDPHRLAQAKIRIQKPLQLEGYTDRRPPS